MSAKQDRELTEIHHAAFVVADITEAQSALRRSGFVFDVIRRDPDYAILKFKNCFVAFQTPTSDSGVNRRPHVGRVTDEEWCRFDTHRDGVKFHYTTTPRGDFSAEELLESTLVPATKLNPTETVLELFKFDGGSEAYHLYHGNSLAGHGTSKNDDHWDERVAALISLTKAAGGRIDNTTGRH